MNVDIGDITPEASFVKDLGADSINSVKEMMTEEFGVDVPDEMLETVGETTSYLMLNALGNRVCEVIESTDIQASLGDIGIATADAQKKFLDTLGVELKLKDENTVQEMIDMIKEEIFPQGE
ncbi:MAG: phosphopantetheine-binding protein [Candidatus Electryoneaceae bacterium]|nr:phosphopantetheine-binding protein [Candidatus Electryoneaceae bacterium]